MRRPARAPPVRARPLTDLPADIVEPIAAALRGALGARHSIRRTSPVAGGCISHARRVETDGGALVFLKYRLPGEPAPGMLAAEAHSLRALHATGALRVPAVLAAQEAAASWLLLEWLEPSAPGADGWRALGAALARLHDNTGGSFGWEHDNFIGSLHQANPRSDDWAGFWFEERLAPRFAGAREAGLLDADDRAMLDALRRRLPAILAQAVEDGPSLLHGDLWGGNVHFHADGPALIDPSSYYGHREVDLAMAGLFGGFPATFFETYRERSPLRRGHEQRRAVYQLYYLLVHVELFGRGYVERTRAALRAALA